MIMVSWCRRTTVANRELSSFVVAGGSCPATGAMPGGVHGRNGTVDDGGVRCRPSATSSEGCRETNDAVVVVLVFRLFMTASVVPPTDDRSPP
jgi:hypothetical protein